MNSNNNSDDATRRKNGNQDPSSILSAYAIDKLEKAVIFMIAAYMNDNMVSRTQVVNMLEEIIHKVEARVV